MAPQVLISLKKAIIERTKLEEGLNHRRFSEHVCETSKGATLPSMPAQDRWISCHLFRKLQMGGHT